MYNWLKVINLSAEERTVKLRIDEGNNILLPLQPNGGIDLPLHDPKYGTQPNTIGVVSIEDTEPGKVFSQIVRVKPTAQSNDDFVLSTDVE